MRLARWPNDGWLKITGVPDGKDGGKFTYAAERPKRWANTDDVWVHGFWTWDWADSYEKVKSIDTEKHEIATYEPHGVYGYTAGKRFYFLNILEELNDPGEWYLDRGTGVLYFLPPAPVRDGQVFVSILEKPIVSLRNISNVTMRNFTFEISRGVAVEIVNGIQVLIAGSTLRNIGTTAIEISGGSETGIAGCDIYYTGENGIRLQGGDRKTLTPAGNFAVNNDIHHFSRWVLTYTPAIYIGGVGNRIANNLLHDGPHEAILLNGNDHIIEYNEIYNVCTETIDVGAFYLGRDWTERGNIVRYNFFHNIHSYTGYYTLVTTGAMAVYVDDCASGLTVFGNIFYKAAQAVFIGGGRDNLVENNIFVQCEPPVHIDARGMGWAKDMVEGTLKERLNAMNYLQPPYSTRYPQLINILNDDPAVPKGNAIIRNIFTNDNWLRLSDVDRGIVTIQNNLVEADPGFVDPSRMNFQLKADSPAWKLGFKRIPTEKIGLYIDEYRTALPAR